MRYILYCVLYGIESLVFIGCFQFVFIVLLLTELLDALFTAAQQYETENFVNVSLGYRGAEWDSEAAFPRTECQNVTRWDSCKSPLQAKGDRNGTEENDFRGAFFSFLNMCAFIYLHIFRANLTHVGNIEDFEPYECIHNICFRGRW